MPDDRIIRVALAGNPNCGKTTLFNNLTGASQHVGNYPGVTIERVEGDCEYDGVRMTIVDLPGTYSLATYTPEERVARQYILEERPDVVVNVLDSSNLERNLYLTIQLIELGAPLVLAFNMSDIAEARGIKFDEARLSEFFGAPIVRMVGSKNTGGDELLATVARFAGAADKPAPAALHYGKDIEEALVRLEERVTRAQCIAHDAPERWLALKLLEGDEQFIEEYEAAGERETVAIAHSLRERIERMNGEQIGVILASRRYGFISGACQETVRSTIEVRHTVSDTLDVVLTHPVLGMPAFLALMYAVFYLTFRIGEYPVAWTEMLFGWMGDTVAGLFPAGDTSLLKSLLVDGAIGGVGGVVTFLPNILLLFLAIAFLEGTGYMARAAFVTDQLMHKVGLHGKSFVPLLLGFGCSVPAIMATRTLESRRDRLTTMLIIPLMSCGARLPIYALFIPAFFPSHWQAPVLWGLYLTGIAFALLGARLLRSTLFRGESTPFVMELPPYRMPMPRALALQTWINAWMYLRKAGTVILGASILFWAAATFPRLDTAPQLEARMAALAAEQRQIVDKFVTATGNTLSAAEMSRFLSLETPDSAPEPPAGLDIRAFDFLQAVKDIRTADDRFEKAVAQGHLSPDSAAYQLTRQLRDTIVLHISHAHPEAFALAHDYLERWERPWRARFLVAEPEVRVEALSYSAMGRFGRLIEPVLAPLGFDWRIGSALMAGVIAKEMVVAQLGILFAAGDVTEEAAQATLSSRLRETYSPLCALCIMVFCLLSSPCVATLAATWQESRSWRWPVFQVACYTALAYVVTFCVRLAGLVLT